MANVVETRKRDVVIRIADWTRDKHEPAYDVECYVGGAYSSDDSKTFSTRNAGRTKRQAKEAAVVFAQQRIEKLVGETKNN